MCTGTGPSTGVSVAPQSQNPWRTLTSSYSRYQLPVPPQRGRDSPLPSSLGFWRAWSCAGLPHAVPAGDRVHMLFSCRHLLALPLKIFIPALLWRFLSLATFRAECSASLLAGHQPVRVSVLITIYYKTKRLWWGLKDELILQGGLIWCPLSRILVLGSLLGSMTYSATADSTRHALHFVEWALISRPKKKKKWLVTSVTSVPLYGRASCIRPALLQLTRFTAGWDCR